MKYIEFDNHLRASYSFAAEEFIMKNAEFDDEYFMFWRTNPCLMIGRFQNTVEEINQKFAEENHIEITRRNSGGGTVYTDPECWQFSFITFKKNGKAKNFQEFTKPVLDALKNLGAAAEFTNRNDLTIAGKKFSGNAQYATENRFLHHGTLLFNTNIDNLVLSLKISEDKIISKGIKSVRERVNNLKPFLTDPQMSSTEFRNNMIALIKGDMETVRFNEKHIESIEEIENTKFRTWEWNYGASPEFNISKSHRFAGGKLEVQLMVKSGVVRDCKIYGDFFCSGNINHIQDAVIGCKYEKEAIAQALTQTQSSDMLYLINAEELLSCFIA
jgi:lipoate-protein ligase A